MPSRASFPMWPRSPASAKSAPQASGAFPRPVESHARIGTTRHDHRRKRKRLHRHWRERADEVEGRIGILDIRRCDEERGGDLFKLPVVRLLSPFDRCRDSQRMREDDDASRRRRDARVKPCDPVAGLGLVPVGLENPARVWKCVAPVRDPVVPVAVAASGNRQEIETRVGREHQEAPKTRLKIVSTCLVW